MAPTTRLTRRPDGTIWHDGRPWRAGGVNIFQLAVNDYPSPRLMSHGEIDALLDKAVSIGATLVRATSVGVNIGPNDYNLVAGVTGTGPKPTILYREAAWEPVEYAVAAAQQRGVHLMIPLGDEHHYFHGGKRLWVNHRFPGRCSTLPVSDPGYASSANSPAERAAESAFFTDQQVVWDYEQWITDFANHPCRYLPGTPAFKDVPAVAILQPGNEMWPADDFRTWQPRVAEHITTVAPQVLVADAMSADGSTYWATQGQDPVDHIVTAEALASRHIHLHGIHPYTVFDVAALRRAMAKITAAGKVGMIDEYAWSKTTAPAFEDAARADPRLVLTAPWSLQNDADLHQGGGADRYGSDDASLYVPGKTQVERDAVTRLRAHGEAMAATPAPALTGRLSVVVGGARQAVRVRGLWAGGALTPVVLHGAAPPPPAPAVVRRTDFGAYRPDATTTGAYGTLTAHAGDLVVTTPGALIEGLDVSGILRIKANGVTVRRCRVRGGDRGPGYRGAVLIALVGDQVGALIEDCTVAPSHPVVGMNGVQVTSATVRRCDISGSTDGIVGYGDDVTLTGNYVHDLIHYAYDPAQSDGSHDEPVQFEGGARGVIVGNALTGGYNAGIMVTQNHAKINSLGIERNWIGGGNITLNTSEKGKGAYAGLRVVDNVFLGTQRNTDGVHAAVTATTRAVATITGNTVAGGATFHIINAGS